MRCTQKFKRIAASVREIGVVEPLVVARDRRTGNGFIVLDGHMRLEVLKDLGEASALCLIATDDEPTRTITASIASQSSRSTG